MKIKKTYEDFCDAQALTNKLRAVYSAVESQAPGALNKSVDLSIRTTLAKSLGGSYMELATEGLAPMPINGTLERESTLAALTKVHGYAQESLADAVAKVFGFKKAISVRGASEKAKEIVRKLKASDAEIDSQALIRLLPAIGTAMPRDNAQLVKALTAQVQHISVVQKALSDAASAAWALMDSIASGETVSDDAILAAFAEHYKALQAACGAGVKLSEGGTGIPLLGGYMLKLQAPEAVYGDDAPASAMTWQCAISQTERSYQTDYTGVNLTNRQEVELGLAITGLGRVEKQTLSAMDQVQYTKEKRQRLTGFELDENFNTKDNIANSFMRFAMSLFAAWGVVSYVVIGEALTLIDEAIFINQETPIIP